MPPKPKSQVTNYSHEGSVQVRSHSTTPPTYRGSASPNSACTQTALCFFQSDIAVTLAGLEKAAVQLDNHTTRASGKTRGVRIRVRSSAWALPYVRITKLLRFRI